MPRPNGMRGGSRKGIPNSDVSRIRSMVATALHRAGGVDYLQRQAEENPNAFMALLAKCLPRDVITTAELGPNLSAALADAMSRRSSLTRIPVIDQRVSDGEIIDGEPLPALPVGGEPAGSGTPARPPGMAPFARAEEEAMVRPVLPPPPTTLSGTQETDSGTPA
jgi:hypothetical protein